MAELAMVVRDGDEEIAVFEVDASEQYDSDLELAAESGLAARAQTTLHQALNRVRPALGQIAATMRELGPDETEIEFGLKIGGETGVIIAKGTTEVNFVVRMTWKRGGS